MDRKLHISVAALVIAIFGFGAWLNLRQNQPADNGPVSGMVVNASIGGPFNLIDHTGKPFTNETLVGDYALIYFGYTFCPDVCPTELGKIAVALDLLDKDGDHVRPVMITIDPERDTPEVLAEYVPLFHERLIGLTGTDEDVREVATSYRVFYRRFEDPSYTYDLMDHTSFIYLLAPSGEIIAMFRYGTPPEEIANAIRHHMRGNARG